MEALSAADVQGALAALANASTPTQQIEELYRRSVDSMDVMCAIARHPNCPVDRWCELAGFLPEHCRMNPTHYQGEERFAEILGNYLYQPGSARGWHASPYKHHVSQDRPERYKMLHYLAHGRGEDQRYVLSLPRCPFDILIPYLTGRNALLRKTLATRETLPPGGFEQLARDSAASVRQALAENAATPVAILALLANDTNPKVAAAAAAHAACPADAVHAVSIRTAKETQQRRARALNELEPVERLLLLGDLTTSAQQIEELSTSSEPHVRGGCALHPNASTEILARLAADPIDWVRECVAFNTNTPLAVLATLSAAAGRGMLLALANNPSLTTAMQMQLIEHGDDEIRRALADTAQETSVLEALARTPPPKSGVTPWQEHLATVLNPDTDRKTLRRLHRDVRSASLFLTRRVAVHPNCPESLYGNYAQYQFDVLANNPNVALTLLENPNAITREPYEDWLLDEWQREGGLWPGHVVRYYLRTSIDAARKRQAASARMATQGDLQSLVFTDDIHLRKRLTARKTLTRFMLEALARDPKPQVRELIAKREELPALLLKMLAADPVRSVQEAARDNAGERESADTSFCG